MVKRKLLSMILAMSMLCSLFAAGVSAEETVAAPVFTDITGLSCEEAVNHLAAVGIVNGRSEGIYAPNEGLTRAEMTAIILRAFGADDVEPIEKFKDVPTTHWAYNYVETAYKMGIINGMTATTFAPEGAVTYEQAVKMLVCAVNNGSKAEKEGGWPDGYIKVATDMGTLEGISASKGEALSRGTMAQMVYNFLMTAEDTFSYMYDWDNGTVAEHYNWIRDERIRAGYDGTQALMDGGYAKILNELGCNTVFLNLLQTGYAYKTKEGCKKLLDDCLKWMENYDYHTFIKINFGDNSYALHADYDAFHNGVTKSDTRSKNVCPLDKAYWDKQLLERSLMIAERPQYAGIILDFEMYATGGSSGYTAACMCDTCWGKYIKSRNLGSEWEVVPAGDRNEYAVSKKMKDDYNQWRYDEAVKLFTDLREKVHAVNPKIIFGYMPGYEWYKGITEGLGTPERPVIVLSETEYWGSLGTAVNKMRDIKNKGYHALYLPGLYPQPSTALSAEDLEKNIGLVSTTSAGYWMYGAKNTAKEGYYEAVERANKLLDERLEAGEIVAFPTYDTPTYSAKKIKGTVPTEDEWAAAPVTEDFKYYKKPDERTPLVTTNAKILYSDDALFVRVIAYGDPSETEGLVKNGHDGGGIWNGPNVEIFWRYEEQSDIMHLAASTAGTTRDAYCTGIGSEDTGVNFEGFETNTVVFDDRWEMTVRVPGSMDGVRWIQRGDTLKLEISRYHLPSIAAGNTGYLVWSPTHTSFLGSSPLYGTVTLD